MTVAMTIMMLIMIILTIFRIFSEILFNNIPDVTRPWSPPNLQFNGYWISFPRVKRSGRGTDLTSADVKERYSYTFTPPPGLCGLL
jgi:hypothetical protein